MAEGTEEKPPRELVVDAQPAPGDSSDGSGSAMAPIVVTVLASGAAAKFVSPTAGLACLAISLAFLIVRRKPSEGRFVLRVEERTLVVTREKRKEPIARAAIDDVVDVTLDSETRPASRGGAQTERARIALEREGADPIFVPDDRVTSIEALEWQAKVRVFLRKHGWLPKEERPV